MPLLHTLPFEKGNASVAAQSSNVSQTLLGMVPFAILDKDEECGEKVGQKSGGCHDCGRGKLLISLDSIHSKILVRAC